MAVALPRFRCRKDSCIGRLQLCRTRADSMTVKLVLFSSRSASTTLSARSVSERLQLYVPKQNAARMRLKTNEAWFGSGRRLRAPRKSRVAGKIPACDGRNAVHPNIVSLLVCCDDELIPLSRGTCSKRHNGRFEVVDGSGAMDARAIGACRFIDLNLESEIHAHPRRVVVPLRFRIRKRMNTPELSSGAVSIHSSLRTKLRGVGVACHKSPRSVPG